MIKAPVGLQDLGRRLYIKAKAEPAWASGDCTSTSARWKRFRKPLGGYSSAIRAACAKERQCGPVRGAISDGPYRELRIPPGRGFLTAIGIFTPSKSSERLREALQGSHMYSTSSASISHVPLRSPARLPLLRTWRNADIASTFGK